MGDESGRLTRIEAIFGTAVKRVCESGLRAGASATVDAHVDHVRILVGGQLKVLFNVNTDGSIHGPILGFHDTTGLGSIDDDGVENNIAWTIKNELLDQINGRSNH
jgi:hypothetical protein